MTTSVSLTSIEPGAFEDGSASQPWHRLAWAAMIVVGLTWTLETTFSALSTSGLPPLSSIRFLTRDSRLLNTKPMIEQMACIASDFAGLSALVLGLAAWRRPTRTKALLTLAALLQSVPCILEAGETILEFLASPAGYSRASLVSGLLKDTLLVAPYAAALWFCRSEPRLALPVRSATGVLLCVVGVGAPLRGVASLVAYRIDAAAWTPDAALGFIWLSTYLFILLAGVLALRGSSKYWLIATLVALAAAFPIWYPLNYFFPVGRMSVFDLLTRLCEPLGWIVLGPWVALMLRLEDRGHGARPHLCRACGYNLTGNISGICPECGVPIDRDSAQPSASGAGRFPRSHPNPGH